MGQTIQYRNPHWLNSSVDSLLKDGELMKWNKFYNECISHMLKNMGLVGDKTALAFAKKLWYSANADEQTIKAELQNYKEYKQMQEDINTFAFV